MEFIYEDLIHGTHNENIFRLDLHNALITGGSGMIGSKMNFGHKPTSVEMNVCDVDSIRKYIDSHTISCIIHLAAINLRESECNPTRAIDVNINGTSNMLQFAIQRKIPFILISSGAVFSSKNDTRFDVFHKTCPNSMYGYTKEASEKIALLYEKSIVIRTGWLFGGNQKNHYKFVENAINHFNTNNPIKASNDFYGSPTYVMDFINKMKDIICNEQYGIHHVVNDEFANGCDIANEIADILNVDKNLIISESCELIPNSTPRSNTEMLMTQNKMRSWKVALKEYCTEYISKKNIKTTETTEKIKWSNREKCRLCNKYNINVFYKLNPTPPANSFVPQYTIQEKFPLDIAICLDCKHIQLIQIIDPSILYSNYVYVSSTSSTMIKHLQTSVMEFVSGLNKDDHILEIGANDGVCIKHLLDNNFKNVIGIDPAENINKTHNLPIICDFFSSKMIPKLKKYKLIYAFHCCAHIEDIQDVFKTIYEILDDDGSFIMEVGYFYEVYKKKMFDTIYHEHIDYHTVTAMQQFCLSNNMKLYKIKTNNIQSGSIQFFISKRREMDKSVSLAIQNEKKIKLFDFEKLSKWKINIIKCGIDIHNILSSFKDYGKTIVGYGASAKSTTFLYQYNITNKVLDCIIDDNKYKQNLFSPGNIPIKDISLLYTKRVDYIIILSFNFAPEIIKKIQKYRNNGLRIIIPFPEIKII